MTTRIWASRMPHPPSSGHFDDAVSSGRRAGFRPDPDDRDNTLKILALCGISVPIIFAILVTVSGFLYEGYSHMTQAISELGGVEALSPEVQNANFLIIGLLMIGFAFGLRRGNVGGASPKLGPVLIGVFGVSSGIANAVLPCDPGCEFQSLTGTLHNVTGLVGFISAIAGMFVISRGLKGDPFWRRFHRFSLVAAVATLVSLLLWIGVAKAAEVDSVNGLLQRLFIGVWFLWVEVIAIRMFQLSRQSPEVNAP